MPGLRIIAPAVVVTLALCGCIQDKGCSHALGEKVDLSLPELFKAHEEEVGDHGKDLCYLQPIGAFGRQGVMASLEHVAAKNEPVSTYNNTELVFGVAEEARMATGYDMCKDREMLRRMLEVELAASAPEHQRRMHIEFVNRLCKI